MRELPTHPQTPAEIDEQIIRLAERHGALDEEIGRWLSPLTGRSSSLLTGSKVELFQGGSFFPGQRL